MRTIASLLVLLPIAFLTGCVDPAFQREGSDPVPSATISGEVMTVHLIKDLAASSGWTIPKAMIKGQTIYLAGQRTMNPQQREFTMHLPSSINPHGVAVIWVSPDGNKSPLRILFKDPRKTLRHPEDFLIRRIARQLAR